MAFSKTPAIDTHQTKRIPITTGNTLTSDVVSPSAYKGQRYINCYPKRVKQDNADDQWVVTKTPAIVSSDVTYTSSGTDPITAISSDGKYIWKGHRLYASSGGSAIFTAGASSDDFFSMHAVTNTAGTNPLYAGFMTEGGGATIRAYTLDIDTLTETRSTVTFVRLPTANYRFHNAFYNGRLYALGTDDSGTKRIYNSSPGAYTTWASTDYIVPEIVGDIATAILVHKNYLVAFGTQSIEFFYDNAVTIGSPLTRQESLYVRLGVKEPYNIAQAGDNLFFISWQDRLGFGIYMLDGFQPVRISDPYVDGILNNTDLITSAWGLQLEVIDMAGDLCVAFPVTTTSWMALSIKNKVWFSISLPAAVDSNFFSFISIPNNAGEEHWTTSYISAYSTGVVTFRKFTKDYAPATSTTAEVVFDITDFGSQYQKHIKSLDVIGDFGNNTVELAWTPYQDYTNWSSFVSITPNTIGHNNTVRFDNLGRFVNFAPRLRVAGTNNMVLRGLEVKYNLGAW